MKKNRKKVSCRGYQSDVEYLKENNIPVCEALRIGTFKLQKEISINKLKEIFSRFKKDVKNEK